MCVVSELLCGDNDLSLYYDTIISQLCQVFILGHFSFGFLFLSEGTTGRLLITVEFGVDAGRYSYKEELDWKIESITELGCWVGFLFQLVRLKVYRAHPDSL